MSNKKFLAAIAGLTLLAGALAAPALAGRAGAASHHRGGDRTRPAQTKLRFKLDDHQWDSGATVTGTAALRSGRGRGEPVEGATLRVLVDGQEVGTATTDAEGKATISWGPATDGGHVMRVVYDGDDTHKAAKRAQGFNVGTGDEGEEDDVEATPTPEPETTPTP